jgi:hypothetical protein
MAILPTITGSAPLNVSDNVYTTFTIDITETLTNILNDTPADFASMDNLTFTVEYSLTTPRTDDVYSFLIRIVNGATILAAADAGGTFTTVSASVTSTIDTTTGPTAWGYVNTLASKATWDGATIELQQGYAKTKGGDGTSIRVDTFSINGNYTAGVAAQIITGAAFVDPDLFGAGTIVAGVATITGATFVDPDLFGSGTVSNQDQFITGTLFEDPDSFGSGSFKAPFIFKITTTVANEVFTIPCPNTGTYNAVINWGDGGPNSAITLFDDADLIHTFVGIGSYTITISGTLPGVAFKAPLSRLLITEVVQLGELGWLNFLNAFADTSNLTIFNAGTTDTSLVTTMQGMFNGAGISGALDVSSFNVSNVTSLRFFMGGAVNVTTLNCTGWNTSSVNDMFGFATNSQALTDIIDVENFDITLVTQLGNFIAGGKITQTRYDALLVNWEATPGTPVDSVTANFGSSLYTQAPSAAATARASLISRDLWTITDGGSAPAVGASPQTLTGATFSDPDAFGAGTVSAGAAFITGAVFVDPDAFGNGTITAGAVAITGSTFVDPDAFGGGTVTQTTPGQVITGAAFADPDAFGAGTVSPGVVAIAGATFADPDAFGSGNVSVSGGAQSITGSTYLNASTFGGSSVTTTFAITGATLNDPDTFPGSAVSAAYNITGATFIDPDAFGSGSVSTASVISGATLIDPDAFGSGNISIANSPQAITGATYNDPDAFGASSVTTQTNVTGAALVDPDSFGSGTVTQQALGQSIGGAAFSDPDAFGGGSVASIYAIGGADFADPDVFGAGLVVVGGVTITGAAFISVATFGAGSFVTLTTETNESRIYSTEIDLRKSDTNARQRTIATAARSRIA